MEFYREKKLLLEMFNIYADDEESGCTGSPESSLYAGAIQTPNSKKWLKYHCILQGPQGRTLLTDMVNAELDSPWPTVADFVADDF